MRVAAVAAVVASGGCASNSSQGQAVAPQAGQAGATPVTSLSREGTMTQSAEPGEGMTSSEAMPREGTGTPVTSLSREGTMTQSAEPGEGMSRQGTATPITSQSREGTMTQSAAPGEPSAARLVTATADVESIDRTNRVVTLKTDKGQVFDLKAGPNVNLDRVQIGDRITAQFYQEIVLDLRPAAIGVSPSITRRIVDRGGVAELQATLTAEVVSVDPEHHMVTVRGPQATRTLYVQDPYLQSQLTSLRPQSNVTVIYTQAVAVSLEPRK
jgi:hypothetical protein